jgi:hypothetical protein
VPSRTSDLHHWRLWGSRIRAKIVPQSRLLGVSYQHRQARARIGSLCTKSSKLYSENLLFLRTPFPLGIILGSGDFRLSRSSLSHLRTKLCREVECPPRCHIRERATWHRLIARDHNADFANSARPGVATPFSHQKRSWPYESWPYSNRKLLKEPGARSKRTKCRSLLTSQQDWRSKNEPTLSLNMFALQKYRMNKFDGPSEGLRLRHEAGEKKVLQPSRFSLTSWIS